MTKPYLMLRMAVLMIEGNLDPYCDCSSTACRRRVNVDRAVRDLERVTHHKSLLPGDKLFGLEDPSMELFLIESGSINLRVC